MASKKGVMPPKLKRYQSLRSQAKRRGITVPRGTSLDELEQLVAGTKTEAAVRKKTTARKTAARKAKSKPRTARVPRGAKTIKSSWGW